MATPSPSSHPGVDLDPGLLIPVRGEEVAASRYSPTDRDGPLPAVLIATPYRKDDRITFGSWDPSIHYLARHGYEVVVMDLLGTGASTGRKDPFDGGEGAEVAAVIDWLADREWTTGKVGTFGLSYGAWTQYQAAAENPDALGAMVAVSVTPSVYESSWTGGAFNLLKRATWPATMQAMRALPPSRRDSAGRWADVWRARLKELREDRPWLFQFLDHPTLDGFWRDRLVRPEAIDVPILAACGYRDVHTGPMVEFVDAIDAPKRLLVGPWRHTMPENGREVAIDFRRQAVAWFDRFLEEGASEAPSGPTVAYWTEREGGWTPEGAWRPAERWPSAVGGSGSEAGGEGTVTLALSPDGLVPTEDLEGSLERAYCPDFTVGMESLERVGSVPNPGIDTSADDARSLVFGTGPLPDAVELTGTAEATVRLRATAPDPLVAVRVVDVGPTGTARLVTSGYRRASHRHGHESPDPVEPGETVPVSIPLTPKSHVFEAGRRIRVAVAGAAFPRALPAPADEGGSFVVLSEPGAPSGVTFPGRVHDGAVSLGETLSFSPPDDAAVPTASTFATDLGSDWETARSHARDTATFRTWNAYSVALPHGATFRFEHETEAGAARRDPGATSLRDETTLALEYADEVVRAETTARTAPEVATIATTVTVDDRVVFDERWVR